MNVIKPNDLQLLSRYKFIEKGSNRQNTHLIGLIWLKQGSTWRQELIEVRRQDASCWSLFLSLFGMGKLKYISLSLDKICSHLSHYQWKEIKLKIGHNPQDDNYKAFKTVCHLANRQMQRHRYFQLFKEVSDLVPGDFNHYSNLAMKGRFLLNLQRYRLPAAKGLELRFKSSHSLVGPNQRLTRTNIGDIEVGFKYELLTEEEDRGSGEDRTTDTIYFYHYPSPPYYSVDTRNHKLLPKRKEL